MSRDSLARVVAAGEWVLVLGLAAMFAWTTLCLGGYLAATMVTTAWALWGLTALGAVLFALRPRAFNPVALLPVPFLLFALASVLWLAPAKWLAWREWLLWLQMWLVFVLVLHFGRSRGHTLVWVVTFVGLGLTGVAMAAYQRFVDPSWMMLGRTQAEQFFGRSAGMFGIPNSLAGLFEVMLPLCLVWLGARSTRVTVKFFCVWFALLLGFALVLTGSRGGWIAVTAALLAWPVLAGRNWRRGLLGGAAVLAVIAGGLAALYAGSEHARARIDPFLEGKFEHTRPLIWKVGVQLWQEAPWLGTGAASYNVLFDRHRPAGFVNEPDWTHNDYLNTLSDYGAVGFALWAGAGAVLLALGWRAWRTARSDAGTTGARRDFTTHWRWKFGLWLGLLAYAVHLGVDFHTKIPALAYAGAIVAGLLLRGRAECGRAAGWGARGAALALGAAVLALGAVKADPLYRAEALRFDARRAIDRQARGKGGTLDRILPSSLIAFQQAVKIDPTNAQAWGDLSYAVALSWHVTRGNVVATGRRAEAAAREALARCPVIAEFWVHQGVALDMQARQAEAEPAFRRALALAPTRAEWHYYFAHHLSARPGRTEEALAAAATCLALDPSYGQAEALRARLTVNR